MKDKSKPQGNATAQQVRANSVGWLIKSLSIKFDNEMLKNLKLHGLNLGQFAIIMTLFEGDNITQTQIGKSVLMPAYATTRNLDVLEKSGYLKRFKSETSRRSFCIRLTEKGKLLAPVLFPIVKSVNKKRLASLSNKEEALLKQLLIKILQA